MASRAYRSAGLIRSLALLWSFVLASGTILVVAALVLSSVLTNAFWQVAKRRPGDVLPPESPAGVVVAVGG